MSPLPLRRYRAERLLRKEFKEQREQVLGPVRVRLRARGVTLAEADLEACYATAWQGLYAALLEGETIESPTGWLTQVCFRRGIDEARSRTRRGEPSGAAGLPISVEPDLASALDDSRTLRHTFEALRGMSTREREAATLCYLQGLTRAEAAERLNVSEAHMHKLMEGRGPERPGVAAKMNGLLRTIGGGEWCEQQGSLMRALAFGILDPQGERYQLALLHRRECPACRAYIVSLRGLAAVLPPLALPWGPGAVGFGGGAAAGAGAGGGAAGAGGGAAGAGSNAGAGAGASAAPSAAGLGGAAGGGAAGGWLPLGGSLGVKLAAGCLLAVGVGGGCVALVVPRALTPHHAHHRTLAVGGGSTFQGASLRGAAGLAGSRFAARAASTNAARSQPSSARRSQESASAAVAARAQRELGFERASSAVVTTPSVAPTARTSRAGSSRPSPSSSATPSSTSSSSGGGAATREFGIE